MAKSLYDFIDAVYGSLLDGRIPLNEDAYNLISTTPFEEMINNDDKCLKLIQAALEFKSGVARENRHRASHILVTWLLGIGMSSFFKLDNSKDPFSKKFFPNLWLQTAMLHDYGYLCDEISNRDLALEDIVGEYDLLSDTYFDEDLSVICGMTANSQFAHYFTYSYQEIREYFAYGKHLHKKDILRPGVELNDHGIVGACIAFRKYCEAVTKKKKIKPSPAITQIQKIACIVAASHNIFKSSDAKTDNIYIQFGLTNLLSSSEVRVNKENILLLLMSLVDTIECTKRFSQKSNPKQYLQQATTLKYVDVEIEDGLLISFSRLHTYIERERKSEEMKKTLNSHINGLRNISSWTSFSAEYNEDVPFDVRIRL